MAAVGVIIAPLLGTLLDPHETLTLCHETQSAVAEDLLAYRREPVALKHRGWPYAFDSVLAWRAVAVYRVSHALLQISTYGDAERRFALDTTARQMSEVAREWSDVEINPHAEIGARLLIDHGAGTVVGEDVRIGDDCVLLDQVRLGGRDVADGPVDHRRHPTLGNNVRVSYGASVLGPINLGDDVLIGPRCVVTRDVPAGSTVTIRDPHELRVRRATQRSLTR